MADGNNVDIPIIDLQNDLSIRDSLIHQVRQACEEVGFFQIINYGAPFSLVDQVFSSSAWFFQLSKEEKELLKLSQDTNFRGYSAVGEEVTLQRRDMHECLDMMRDFDERDWKKSALHGRNLWPKGEEGKKMKKVFTSWWSLCERIGQFLMSLIAKSFGLSVDYFDQLNQGQPGFCVMRSLTYPAIIHEDHVKGDQSLPIGIGIGQHTDYGMLTLLLQDEVGGLQIQSGEEKWIAVTPRKDALVVNIGDMLALWSKGQCEKLATDKTNTVEGGTLRKPFRATLHRVLVPPRRRYSVPFFYEPAFDVELPTENGKKVHYGNYLLSKYVHSFPGAKS